MREEIEQKKRKENAVFKTNRMKYSSKLTKKMKIMLFIIEGLPLWI